MEGSSEELRGFAPLGLSTDIMNLVWMSTGILQRVVWTR